MMYYVKELNGEDGFIAEITNDDGSNTIFKFSEMVFSEEDDNVMNYSLEVNGADVITEEHKELSQKIILDVIKRAVDSHTQDVPENP